LPVALFVLLAGTLNLLSFRELNKEHQTALAETAEDQRKLSSTGISTTASQRFRFSSPR
jgi:hypothetical protein